MKNEAACDPQDPLSTETASRAPIMLRDGGVQVPLDPGNERRLEWEAETAPRSATVSFVTTEHFTLQGARSTTVAESTGRASIFLGSVSGGLIALGLVATATHVGTAFYAFSLILLPTLAFAGLVTFDRVLQSGIENLQYARRISRLRSYYFEAAPELTHYLQSAPPTGRLAVQGLRSGLWQVFLTVAGMVAVVTAILSGSAAGLLAAAVSGHSLVAALLTGGLVSIAALVGLTFYQASAWRRAHAVMLFDDDEGAKSRS